MSQKYTTVGGIPITNDVVRCLGIYIGLNQTQCYELNWLKTSEDMQKLLESWKKRKLTIFGKAYVVNSLGISQLIYKASIFPFPNPEYIQQIKKNNPYLTFCRTNMIE